MSLERKDAARYQDMYHLAFYHPSIRDFCGVDTRQPRHPSSSRVPLITIRYPPSYAPLGGQDVYPARDETVRVRAQREAQRRHRRRVREDAVTGCWYLAQRDVAGDAVRRRTEEAMRRRVEEERAEIAAWMNELFDDCVPSAPEGTLQPSEADFDQAERFSDSEVDPVEEDVETTMDGLLDSFLHGFGLQRDEDDVRKDTSVEETPAAAPDGARTAESTQPEEVPSNQPPTSDKPPTSSIPEETLTAIEQAYSAHATRVTRLETLESLHASLLTLTDGFTFPTSLDFQPVTAANDVPGLSYTSRNAPFHAQAQALLGLLVAADAVGSDGDAQVRSRRKEFVKAVEAELDALEEGKVRVWRGQRASV